MINALVIYNFESIKLRTKRMGEQRKPRKKTTNICATIEFITRAINAHSDVCIFYIIIFCFLPVLVHNTHTYVYCGTLIYLFFYILYSLVELTKEKAKQNQL